MPIKLLFMLRGLFYENTYKKKNGNDNKRMEHFSIDCTLAWVSAVCNAVIAYYSPSLFWAHKKSIRSKRVCVDFGVGCQVSHNANNNTKRRAQQTKTKPNTKIISIEISCFAFLWPFYTQHFIFLEFYIFFLLSFRCRRYCCWRKV